MTVLCVPAKGPDDGQHPDSAIRWCMVCGGEVWASPASLALTESDFLCLLCAPGSMALNPGSVGISDETRAELHAAGFSDEEIEVAKRRMRVLLGLEP
jgi:hypothetical protein